MNNLASHISQPTHSYPTLPLSETKELFQEEYGELRDRVEERIRYLENRLPSNQIDPTLTRATLRLPKESYGLQYLENPHQHHHGINSACKYCVMEKEYENLTKIQARNLHSPSISSNNSHKNGPMQVCPQVESMYALGEGYGLEHRSQREREKEREENHVPLVEKLPLQSNSSNQNSSYPSSGTLNHRSGDSVLSINEALMENLRVQKEMNNNLKALSEKLSDLSLRRSDSGSGYDEPGRQGLMNNQDPHINSHVNTHSHVNTQSHPNLTNTFLNNRREVQFHSNQHHGNFTNEYNSHDYYYGQPFRKQYQFREREEHIYGYIHSPKNDNNRNVYEQPRERYFEENEEEYRNEKVYPRKGKNPEGRSESYDGYMRYREGSIEDKYKSMRNHCFYPNYQRIERSNNLFKHSESAQGRTKSVSEYSSSISESRKKNNGLRGIKEISSPKKSKFSRTRNNNSDKDSQNDNEIIQQRQSSHSRRKMESEYFISRKRENIEEDGETGGIQANKISDNPNRDAQYRNKNHEKEHPIQAFSEQQKARKELLYKIGKNFDAAYGVK